MVEPARKRKRLTIRGVLLVVLITVAQTALFVTLVPQIRRYVTGQQVTGQPQATAKRTEPLIVTILPDGRILLMDQEVRLVDLVTELQTAALGNLDQAITVRIDRNLKDDATSRVLNVMGVIIGSGFRKAALQPEPASENH